MKEYWTRNSQREGKKSCKIRNSRQACKTMQSQRPASAWDVGALHHTNLVLLMEETTYLDIVMQLKYGNMWKTYQQNIVISLKSGNLLSSTFLEISTYFQFHFSPESDSCLTHLSPCLCRTVYEE